MKTRYFLTIYRLSLTLNKNMKVTHRWKKFLTYSCFSKSEALSTGNRWLRISKKYKYVLQRF